MDPICAFEYFLCILLGQSGIGLPQKGINQRNMQFRYPKNFDPYGRSVTGSEVVQVTVAVAPLFILLFFYIFSQLNTTFSCIPT